MDNNGPLLVVDTECPGTRDYLGQMVRGEIPNCMPELTPKELVNSGFLFGKFIYFNQFFNSLHNHRYRSPNHFLALTNIPIRLHQGEFRPLKKGECTSEVLLHMITLCTARSNFYYSLFALNRQLYSKFFYI